MRDQHLAFLKNASGALVASCVLAVLPTFAAAEQNSPFGVVSAAGIANDVCRQNDLSALGTGWVRAGWLWPDIEVAQDNFQWEEPDRMMNDLTARGIWVYWDFSYAPCWANGRPCDPGSYGPGSYSTSAANGAYTPLSQADLRQYVMTVVTRYHSSLGYKVVWGTWNEPDLLEFYRPPGGRGGLSNISRYVVAGRELRTIVDAIHDADPQARIVTGELSDAASGNRAWLKQILDAAAGRFDGITLHIYGSAGSAPGLCDKRLGKLDAFRSDLVSWGYGAYPVWVTETGGGLSDFGGSIEGQRAFIECFWGGLRFRPWWKKAFWYRYEYEPNQTGLLDGGPDACSYTPNLKYWTYQTLINQWPALPERPSHLVATAGNGRVSLSWSGAPGAESYTVKRTPADTAHHVPIATGVTGTSYADTGVASGTTYSYVVSAQSSAGESLDSEQAAATPTGGGTGALLPGQGLSPDQSVTSNDGRFHLYYQGDGNLVLYRWDGLPLWSSGTFGRSAGLAVMQGDGNFVVYDKSWVPEWHSSTWGNPAASLLVQNDGNVVVYSAGGTPLWSTGTCCW